MSDKNKPLDWCGRRVLSPDDVEGLERKSAEGEFLNKMPRGEAEKAAYAAYARKQHLKAAGYHARGMDVSKAAGFDSEAKKHWAMYVSHLGALGYNPYDAVPPDVEAQKHPVEGQRPDLYRFSPHGADDLLFSPAEKK